MQEEELLMTALSTSINIMKKKSYKNSIDSTQRTKTTND